MKDRQVSVLGLIVAICMIGMLIALSHLGSPVGGRSDTVVGAIDALPASGAGHSASQAPAAAVDPRTDAYLGGTRAIGRIAEVYVKVADNVFLAVDQAPEHLRASAERWVDVQFPEMLANDTGSARAILNRSVAGVKVGDVVEIKFAHKDNSRYFPVKELTRVTELVAGRDQVMAKDFERRILARNAQKPAAPEWLTKATAAQSAQHQLPFSTTADASR